jgi:hypothetical protein
MTNIDLLERCGKRKTPVISVCLIGKTLRCLGCYNFKYDRYLKYSINFSKNNICFLLKTSGIRNYE